MLFRSQFDPFWVSAYPYRVDLTEAGEATVAVTVRNFRDRPQRHHVSLALPPGLKADPPALEGTIDAKSRKSFQVRISANRDKAPPGTLMVPMDITLDGRRQGQRFDFLIRARSEMPE